MPKWNILAVLLLLLLGLNSSQAKVEPKDVYKKYHKG
jgi:hypothetical protein